MYALGNQRPDIEAAMHDNVHTSPQVKQQMAKTYLNPEDIPLEVRVNYKPFQRAGIPTTVEAYYQPPNMTQGDPDIWNDIKHIFTNPYFAPLMADSLEGLPEAYIFSAQYDVMRDDSFWYAERLRKDKVKVIHHHAENGFHGMFFMHQVPAAKERYWNVIEYLKCL